MVIVIGNVVIIVIISNSIGKSWYILTFRCRLRIFIDLKLGDFVAKTDTDVQWTTLCFSLILLIDTITLMFISMSVRLSSCRLEKVVVLLDDGHCLLAIWSVKRESSRLLQIF